MPGLGAIGFLSPFLLLGLLLLPLLWWLLRATPPAAIRRLFPAVVLLLGLKDPETTPHKTPWWLLMLRMLAISALILGFAGPILNPDQAKISRNPLLILRDGGWASAPDWRQRQEKVTALLEEAARLGRPVALVNLADVNALPDSLAFQAGTTLIASSKGDLPQPHRADYSIANDWAKTLLDDQFDTIWLSDGLAADAKAELAETLSGKGNVSIIEAARPTLALRPAEFRDGTVIVTVLRDRLLDPLDLTVSAYGPDPAGIERRLAEMPVEFAPEAMTAEITFDLPSELRNRITRFSVDTIRSAGAQSLGDDRLKRRKVVLLGDGPQQEGQALVSPLHFLRKALAPNAELIEAPLNESLLANPDVIVLADVAGLVPAEAALLLDWVEAGGMLLRFAGPNLAAASVGVSADDPLLPVRLRSGGRSVGGAMSWGAPKKLDPFVAASPFYGLEIPADVEVTAQVIAEPGPLLAERTIAALQDGTPLVTQKEQGDGRVVLVHVSANAEWSTLPLSGLFVQMLDRLAVSTSAATPDNGDLAGQLWQPIWQLSGFGEMVPADHLLAIPGEQLSGLMANPKLPPGLYQNADRQVAVNVIGAETVLARAEWPDSIQVLDMSPPVEQPLKAYLLALGLLFLMLDILATLFLSGRLTGPRSGLAASLAVAVLLVAPEVRADDTRAQTATSETVLAFVITGDSRVDRASEAGLYGLSRVLTERTAIEPIDPIGVDLERDELAFYPLIYWPISEEQPVPSAAAYQKLNTYIRNGGMILFDTRDANIGRFGSATPNGNHLRRLAAGLDVPALEPVPSDHVLTRSFYLLQDFPGRHSRGQLWVEAAPKDAERIEGVPFRNLNDGVSPILIGGNDWAAAWALSREGRYLYPVGRSGFAGQRQREIAYRFGVNLVMYVLTGNYKSDQVHVPALLERLGQ